MRCRSNTYDFQVRSWPVYGQPSNFLGRKKASVDGKVGFSVLAESGVSFQNPAGDSGYGTPGELRPKADVVSTTTFSKVEEGGAAVNVGSMSSIADDNYINVQRARGDAVVVDLPVWEGLMRDAYRSYNTAIVASIIFTALYRARSEN